LVQLTAQIHKFQELAEKYRIEFKSRQGQNCVVRFNFSDYDGASTTLIGTDKPFVLREFNMDEDIFKPVRPQQAEIQILTNLSGVSIDSFLRDTDNEIVVYFDFGTWGNYWIGYLTQDDFQEIWQDSNHILVLRATDGIGKLSEIELQDYDGNEVIGNRTPLTFIQYAMYKTPLPYIKFYVFNNLFHTSMTGGNNKTPLDQCNVDAKTFQKQVTEYDDNLTVLNKINTAFNQTVFMYKGMWHILRMEELYMPFADNLKGFVENFGVRTLVNKRFDIQVGANSEVKQIVPDMLRFINRRTKKDTISFKYDQFNEIICNETFSRGALTSSTPGLKQYQVDSWKREYGLIGSPTLDTTGYGRKEIYDTTTGQLDENYVYCNSAISSLAWLRSCDINVLEKEKFVLSFDHKFETTFSGSSTEYVCLIMFYGVSNNYTLNNNGVWIQSNASWTTNIKFLTIYYNGSSGLKPEEYQTLSVDSSQFPEDGYFNILLIAADPTAHPGNVKQFANLKLEFLYPFNGYNDASITGNQSIFTKTADIRNEFEEEIFIDDAFSRVCKGTILKSDGINPTSIEWYRQRFSTESWGFRHQNAIANWEHNRFNRNKIDANFYGLTWDDNGTTEPLGLINTIKFVDDDPNKVYGILNLKEIDFSNSTWNATLIELFDEDKDDDGTVITETLDTTATAGTYNAITYAKLTIVSAADFTINSNQDQLTYIGLSPITVPITASLGGNINSRTSSPVLISLIKNTTTIASQSIAIPTTPFPFNANLNVASVTLAYGDLLYIQLSSNITQIQVSTGGIDLSYTVTSPYNYDPYQDKFIYK
jgi:hypothetical protein